MADRSRIEWTDATWNPVAGCSLVSPGCTNCYAMRMAARIERMGGAPHYGGTTKRVNGHPVWTGAVNLAPAPILTAPLHWRRPRRIFVNSMSDLFHEAVPDEWIDRVFAVMALCPQHTFQVLTKRPERMRAYLSGPEVVRRVYGLACDLVLESRLDVTLIAEPAMVPLAPPGRCVVLGIWPLPNVWLGVSVEDQRRADERIPILLDTPAAVPWVSAEPLLGQLDIAWALSRNTLEIAAGFLARGHFAPGLETLRRLKWVVAGGESGPNARPMHPDWARSLRDQCAAARVPFLLKQWGEWAPADDYPSEIQEQYDVQGLTDGQSIRVGKKAAGRLLDGVIHDAFPGGARSDLATRARMSATVRGDSVQQGAHGFDDEIQF